MPALRTSEDALAAIRHKRTGAILPTKKVAHNTRLVFIDTSLIFLRFHKKDIARFTPNGVVIHPGHWYTRSTWERIAEFVGVPNYSRHGLRHVRTGLGFDTLATENMAFDANRRALAPMPAPLAEEIVRRKRLHARRFASFIERSLAMADELFVERPTCAGCAGDSYEYEQHLAEHFLRNEPAPHHPALRDALNVGMSHGALGAQVIDAARERLLQATWREEVLARSLREFVPEQLNFIFPQHTNATACQQRELLNRHDERTT